MSNRKVWFIAEASATFGLPLARYLLDIGCRVALVSGRLDKAYLRAALEADGHDQHGRYGQDFLPIHADLGAESDAKAAIRQTIRRFSRIDFVVNNAGDTEAATFPGQEAAATLLQKAALHHELDSLHREFEVNTFGPFHVLKQVLPHLQRQGSGQVFNFPAPNTGAACTISPIYLATRLAIESLNATLIAEAVAAGISVTQMTRDMLPKEMVAVFQNRNAGSWLQRRRLAPWAVHSARPGAPGSHIPTRADYAQ